MKQNELMTKTEVLIYLEMDAITFNRYAERLGIKGQRKGKYVFFKRPEIEKMKDFLDGYTKLLIKQIEKRSGKKVKLV
ncbi:MAG: hypothetical protein ACI3YI_13200 [Bacteroidaceae bacterium]